MYMDLFDGFTVKLFLDEEGNYIAHFVEMPNVSAFSESPTGAVKELIFAWEGVKKSYRAHGEPIPKPTERQKHETSFNVPIEAQLYRALTHEASEAGTSLYALITEKLRTTASIAQE